VDVCHREGNGTFNLITVAAQAVQAHRNHGDALPGDPVPGNPGFKFDDTCMEVPASICPCDYSAAGLATIGIDSSTLTGQQCLRDTNFTQITAETITQPLTIDLEAGQADPAGFVGCQIDYEQHVIINIFPITDSQATACINDLLAVAPSLGATCPP
jgi:hypothetical protein